MSARRSHPLAAVVLVAALVALAGSPPATGRPAPPPAGAEAGVLAPGARGPVVRDLQRELRRRGLAVAVDGRYGPRTRRAVARLQRRLGLRVNGVVDRPFLWTLGLSVCGLPGPTTARGSLLRLGAYGPRVCALQRALRGAGERRLAVDGGYGPATRDAVRRAQRRLGLRPTGVAGPGLARRLAAAPRAVGAPRGLVPGARGPAVRRLQDELRRRGFAVVADGAYGPRTRTAVARLERRLGLPADGRADRALLRRIGADRPVARHLRAFPVPGPHSYVDEWGDPRPQGPHMGTDIVAARGSRVVAVADGTIERLSRVESGRGGIWLWLRGDDGAAFYYAHLATIAPGLAPGSRVATGRTIGAVGRTGDARGGVYHLHFELHPPGRGAVNPYPQLRAVDTAI